MDEGTTVTITICRSQLLTPMMKDLNGFYVDVSQPDVPLERDVAAIRMNVDDFDTAYQLLLSKGFRNYYGERIVEPPTSKSALMIAPSGFSINLIHHIRK